MSNPLSIQAFHEGPEQSEGVTQVMPQRKLARLLAFAGRTIDDVVNSPVAKREIVHYFKTERLTHRRMEILALEAQWNPLGRSA